MFKWNLFSYLVDRFDLTGAAFFGVMAGCVLLCAVIPYLLGSFNFGLIISRRKYHDDIRQHGSGNAGTTNMLRTYGKRAAVITLLGDMLKALVAVLLGYLIIGFATGIKDPETGEAIGLFVDKTGAAIAGLFVMIGHMFPIFYKFKGGKGVATSAMVVLMIDPLSFVICLSVFIIIVVGTRYVSLGSCMGMILYPIILSAFSGGRNPTAQATAVCMALLVVFMHRENLKRLRDGKESKLSFKKKQSIKGPEAPAEEASSTPVPPEKKKTNKSKK